MERLPVAPRCSSRRRCSIFARLVVSLPAQERRAAVIAWCPSQSPLKGASVGPEREFDTTGAAIKLHNEDGVEDGVRLISLRAALL
ncbi:hypothetical protein NHX12_010093 [Muraenolepis orangiensis]|uniref:Uncharacterized protein n=1 Tax=Muraenolepis orangiensis TaxID=630683 RepID=A0A9Q0DMF3_9TELE|nr:hypothetical protein NHX12_010093 [Muraenolepis orangiensis]